MPSIQDIKKRVGDLMNEKGLNYSNVATQLGKNTSYLQKFVKEKSPKRLEENFRRGLAQILEVDEQELTDMPLDTSILPAHMTGVNIVADKIAATVSSFFKKPHPDTVGIEMLDVSACCGTGIENLSERAVGIWQMPLMDFKAISQAAPEYIKIVKAVGDSMQPTINDGDFVFVDISSQSMGSDGIYVLSGETGLSVKRLQNDYNGNVTIISDNKLYNARPIPMSDIHILGRVVNIVNLRKA